MSRTVVNPLLLLANLATPGAAPSSFRRRTRRTPRARRITTYHLHVEQLEPRHMLSGMAELIDVDVWCKPEAEPADRIVNEYTARAVADLSCSNSRTEVDFEVTDELSCDPDDGTSAQQASPEQLEDQTFESISSCVDPECTPIVEEFHNRSEVAAVGAELDTVAVAIPDADPKETSKAAPILAQRTSNQTASDHATRNVARPVALSQQPVYFSGSTALSGPRWKVSTEELVNADALLEVIGLEEPNNLPSIDSAVAVASAPSPEVAIGNHEVDLVAMLFAQDDSWTVRDELSRSQSQAVIGPSLPEQEESRPQRVCPQKLAPSELVERIVLHEGEESGTSELLTASTPSPTGRLPSWQLLGGMGLWQIIVSARARRQKQGCEKLS